MTELFKQFDKSFDPVKLREEANALILNSYKEMSVENLKLIIGFIDLTSLNSIDSVKTAEGMCEKVNGYRNSFEGIPNVAGICLYPPLIPIVKKELKEKEVAIVSVAAGFPTSQTFMELKTREAQLAVEYGATEVDIVLNLGKFLEANYEEVHDEIKQIKVYVGDARLKVILETGVLQSYDQVWKAAVLAMDAGADFIKTSTGKLNPAATPDSFLVMSKAVQEFYKQTGRKVGIKAAGGIANVEDALNYLHIVKSVLTDKWLNKDLFRIGASRLANNLLAAIYEQMGGKNSFPAYF